MALILVQKYGVTFVLTVDSPPLVLSSNLDTLAQLDLAHANVNPGSRGGGGTLLYELYSYVRRQRVWFSSRFGLK